ncbi:DUF932 domain-containing protein [Thermodesulfobacteriota bacterium]
MAQLATLGEVHEKVDALSKNCFDDLVNVRDLTFDGIGTVRIAGESHHLRDQAIQGIAFRLGIPVTYLKKCSTDLQAYNMNHWIQHEKNTELFFRFDGPDVRAVFSPKYVPVDNWEVLQHLEQMGYGHDTQVQCRLDKEFMSLSILEGKKAFSINGDKFRPGTAISNSEVGRAALSISAFLLRLVCSNGMIGRTDVSKSFRHVSDKILERIPEVLEKIAVEVSMHRDKFKLSMESPVDNPESTMESFNRQFALSSQEKDAVTWAWPFEQGNTLFSVINCYTKASQHEELSAASSNKLQRVGGNILSMLKA